jgi:hypothetical protein
MPLQLGGTDTMRPQLIGWDPTFYEQLIEAQKEIQKLKNQGFIIDYEKEGEARLVPPSRDPNIKVFRILSENGDDRLIWDRRIKDQVKDAFKKFKEFMKKGYSAYVTFSDGSPGHKIPEFDPSLEEILLKASEVTMVPKTCPG